MAHVRSEDGTSDTFGVSAAPSLGLGIKLNRQFGLSLRVVAVNNDDHGGLIAFGPLAQFWFTSRLFVSGGFGIAQYDLPEPVMRGDDRVIGFGGFALNARVGYSVLGTSHRLNVSLEAIPAFFFDDTIVGFALIGSYQYW